MKTVEILQTFKGYPDDTATSETLYKVGDKVDLPDKFAELIVGKGHARAVAAPVVKAPAAPAPVPATPPSPASAGSAPAASTGGAA